MLAAILYVLAGFCFSYPRSRCLLPHGIGEALFQWGCSF
jgi:hypothetical protein